MKVKALVDLEVNGEKHKKGDTFDLSGAAARAAIDAKQVELAPATPAKK